MDSLSLAGAWQGAKAAKELLTAAFEAKVESEVKPKILEAQTRLGEIQDTLFALREQLSQLQDDKRDLQAKLDQAEAWSERLKQYELIKTIGGAVVYQFKGQPHHYACPTCINKKEVQILQDNRTLSGKYRCTGCKNEFPVDPRQEAEPVPISGSWQS